MYQCRDCSKVIFHQICPKNLHRWETSRCPSCKQFVNSSEHQCFSIKPFDIFDFEIDQSTGIPEVNFVVAQYVNGGEMVFRGYAACHDICAWLFTPAHRGYTAIAHNMKE
ncbi:hypothetical protein AVEN_264350-1 [Araneus ventricosus]|uniref:Uncharacterized protein n=1 Tax=Araneus ventricosus TaxID=182803 RepID=A0A4Y2H4H5_ARAVE|nr:hypothetical protein AVEN_264350-1 [Araneus ventricosus]